MSSVTRPSVWVLVLFVLVSMALAWPASNLRVDSAVDRLLPVDDPDRAFYEGAKREFGSEEITVVGVFADDVFAPPLLERLDVMAGGLERVDGVREVEVLTRFETSQAGDDGLGKKRLMPPLPHTPAEAAAFRRRALTHRLTRRTLVSPDATAAAIAVRFDPMPDDEFLRLGIDARVREAVAALDGHDDIAITGLPTIKHAAATGMMADIALFVPLSVVAIAVVLLWAFGTLRGIVLPLGTVLMGFLWTAGLMSLAGAAFTMGTLVLPPLLIGVGVAYSIHVVSRYYVELDAPQAADGPAGAALRHVWLPVFMAALTTLAGFAIFARHPIPSLREFGIYSGFGLTVIVAASLAAVPAVLQLLPLPRRRPRSFDRGSRLSRLVEGSGRFAMEQRRAVLAAWTLVVVLGLWGLGRIRVETDYLRFFDAASAVRVDNARIAAALSGTQLLSIVVEGGAPETMTLPETLAALRELQRFTDAQPGVDKTISLLDYLDTLRETIEPGSASRPFVSQRAVHELLILLDPRDLEHNVNADYSRTNLTAYTHLFASTEVRRLIDDVESFAAEVFPAGVRVHATGTVALLNRSSVALAEGQFSGLQQMFLVLTVLLVALFRSLRLGLLAMVPNVVPVVALFGVMGWASIDLNIATSLIAVVAVGIAVDDTIHYLTTFRSEMALSGDRRIAVERTLQLVGRPILITTVALCAGFLVPCVSTFQPIRQFGLLTSFTMAVALLADLLLLPALLATFHVGDSRQAREGESGRGRDCSPRTPGLGSSRVVSAGRLDSFRP